MSPLCTEQLTFCEFTLNCVQKCSVVLEEMSHKLSVLVHFSACELDQHFLIGISIGLAMIKLYLVSISDF